MSVKNVGSKLAQGVRQIKARQDSTPSAAAESVSIAPAAVKTGSSPVATKPATKPAPANTRESGMQHPDRVWPD